MMALALQTPPTMQRAKGHARLGVRFDGADNRLEDLHQSGCLKLMLPKTYGVAKEAVLINTAGGLTGGDRLNVDITLDEGAHVRLCTQTAERIYRSNVGQAEVELDFTLGAKARFDWLAQETILFEQGAVRRRLNLHMDNDASALLVEPIILGRTAMGEKVASAFLHDSWRVWRSGELAYADEFRLEDFDKLQTKAALGEHVAMATLLWVDPAAENGLKKIRELMDSHQMQGAVSAWNRLLLVRLLDKDAAHMRQDLMRLIENIRGTTLPRVWTM